MHIALLTGEEIKQVEIDQKKLDAWHDSIWLIKSSPSTTSRFGKAIVKNDFKEVDFLAERMPVFETVKFFDSVDAERSTIYAEIKFRNRFGKLDSALLPVYVDLIKEPDDSIFKKETPTNTQVGTKKPYNAIFSIYNPILLLAMGIGSRNLNVQSFFKTEPNINIPYVGPTSATKVFQGLAALYIVPGLLYCFDFYIRKAFVYALNNILEDVRKERYESARCKINNLHIPFLFYFHDCMPRANDLRWYFYYVSGFIGRKTSNLLCGIITDSLFEFACQYAQTPDQKYLALKECLEQRSFYDPLFSIKVFLRGYDAAKENERKDDLKSMFGHINQFDKYEKDIPRESILHKTVGENLRLSLRECISLIKQSKFNEARKIFLSIKLEEYIRAAFPKYVIVYYQLYLIITLCDQDTADWYNIPDTLENISEVALWLKYLDLRIKKYCPEKAKLHSGAKSNYDKFVKKVVEDVNAKTPNILFTKYKLNADARFPTGANEEEKRHSADAKRVAPGI